MDVIGWLIDGDPAVRWQALRDLAHADEAEVAAERARVAHEGLGAALLRAQGDDGVWRAPGKPDWLVTLFTLRLLAATGVDPHDPAVASALDHLAEGFRWPAEHGAKPFFEGEVEPCINGHTLSLAACFGRPSALWQRLLDDQLADGGWNCEAPPSVRSSYHSTLCVLEGLLGCERGRTCPGAAAAIALREARRRGEEYLLERALFRRRSTGEVAHPAFVVPAFPTRYRYDVLRALEHFRLAGGPPDPRLREAAALVAERRQPDGRWLLEASRPDGVAVPFDERLGEPSRWISLRALRVLRWLDGAQPA